MSIESQLSEFLQTNLVENDTKLRDIELILYFYGFRDDLWPTLEDAAIKYAVGPTKSRERARQIIKNKFRDVVVATDLPATIKCSDYIKSKNIHRSDLVSKFFLEAVFFEGEVNIRGLLNILHDLNLCEEYEIYNPCLQKASRSAYLTSKALFIIQKDQVPTLKRFLKVAKTLPGTHGIAQTAFLKKELPADFRHFEDLVEILRADDGSQFYAHNGKHYYLLESRDNALINNLEKIRRVTYEVELEELVNVLSNALKYRTPKYSYPPNEVVKLYIKDSRFTDLSGNTVKLNIVVGDLTKIDEDILSFMDRDKEYDYNTIFTYLKKKGYGKPHIDKAICFSPLIYKNKKKGRSHYTYSLVGKDKTTFLTSFSNERYEEFKRKLKAISIDGTDRNQSVIARREHHILTQWLFDGKKTEYCAICGNEYAVASLVTAHKKSRSECAENERIDPNIVIPLCHYGCDYMYEKGYVYIQDGVVKEGVFPDDLTEWDRGMIRSAINKRVHEQWLQGSSDYFRKPAKLAKPDI